MTSSALSTGFVFRTNDEFAVGFDYRLESECDIGMLVRSHGFGANISLSDSFSRVELMWLRDRLVELHAKGFGIVDTEHGPEPHRVFLTVELKKHGGAVVKISYRDSRWEKWSLTTEMTQLIDSEFSLREIQRFICYLEVICSQWLLMKNNDGLQLI